MRWARPRTLESDPAPLRANSSASPALGISQCVVDAALDQRQVRPAQQRRGPAVRRPCELASAIATARSAAASGRARSPRASASSACSDASAEKAMWPGGSRSFCSRSNSVQQRGGAGQVAVLAIRGRPEQHRLRHAPRRRRACRASAAARSAISSASADAALLEHRAGQVVEQHRRHAGAAAVGAADLHGAAKQPLRLLRLPQQVAGQPPVVEQRAGLLGAVPAHAPPCGAKAASKAALASVLPAGGAIRLGQVHRDVQLRQLRSQPGRAQQPVGRLRVGDVGRRRHRLSRATIAGPQLAEHAVEQRTAGPVGISASPSRTSVCARGTSSPRASALASAHAALAARRGADRRQGARQVVGASQHAAGVVVLVLRPVPAGQSR